MAWLRWWLFAMMLCAVRCAVAEGVVLAPDEERWLAAHPVIVVGTYQEGFAPFESVLNGRVQGMGPDYLARLAESLGIQVSYHVYPDWPALLRAARAGAVDLLMDVSPTTERASYLHFSQPYFEDFPTLVTRSDNDRVKDMAGLRDAVLVSLAEDATAQTAHTYIPGVKLIHADSMRDALRMVADGRAEGYIDDPYAERLAIEAAGLQNELRVSPSVALPISALCLAAPLDRQPLIGALDKALALLTYEEHARLRAPWLNGDMRHARSDDVAVPLSEEERAWLRQLPALRVTVDPTSPPYTLLDRHGQPAGIASDYLREVAKALDLRLSFVPSRNWSDVVGAMAAGKVDLTPAVSPVSPEHARLMDFSVAYLDYPVMIVTRTEANAITGPTT